MKLALENSDIGKNLLLLTSASKQHVLPFEARVLSCLAVVVSSVAEERITRQDDGLISKGTRIPGAGVII